MTSIIDEGVLDIDLIKSLTERPDLFEPGKDEMWTDEHISKYMLDAHLDPKEDMASRRHETIERSCRWLISRLDLKTSSRVIDLGCGPGLYCRGLASQGINCTGVDFSERSILYAREHKGEAEEYILGDYMSLDLDGEYDAAFMIYYDFDVFSDKDRDRLLEKVQSILKDDGYFVFDVLTPIHPEAGNETTYWSVSEDGGFWSPESYLELFQRYYYDEEETKLDQYIIVDEHGKYRLFRIWHRFFTITKISNLLKKHGFVVEDFYGDLTGCDYHKDSTSIGIIARKKR